MAAQEVQVDTESLFLSFSVKCRRAETIANPVGAVEKLNIFRFPFRRLTSTPSHCTFQRQPRELSGKLEKLAYRCYPFLNPYFK